MTQNSDHPRDYKSNSRANLGRPPDFRYINNWEIGLLTWTGWVLHSWKFGHIKTLCEEDPEMPECQWCQSSQQLLELFWCDPNDFLSPLVTMDEIWLYHYDPDMRQSNNQWSGVITAQPAVPQEIPSAKIHWKSSRLPRLFGIKTASSPLIIFQTAKLPIQSVTHLCWCNWRKFQRKNATGNQGDLVLAWQCAGSPGTYNPEETGLPGHPMSSSPTLLSGSGSIWLPPDSWTQKPIEGSPFFVRRGGHCCCRDMVGWTTFWIFLEWLAKIRATG